MKTNRVTLITLGVKDIARACAFYEAIGWVPSEVQDKVAFFDMNGMKFGFYLLDGLAEDTGKPVETLKTGAMTLGQNFPTETEVNAAYEKALSAGATEVTRPEKIFWGGYSGYFADPDGHLWEYAMNPYWELDEDGHLK
ncbi:VOC family protein [Aliiroseovarius sp. F47248L]|uniref:VOC family protein n=1 Tax=Aliiroseovarius sp. F47248L TaxID=2926420 RepID=UPI001FF29FCA|nr:VOC family protein [Aliiroseovarius sp. F47248L]MCK0140108.1 VOC family protein [Aliiroseovarius sp. F47248L]